MIYRKLSKETVDIYLDYLRKAMDDEPDEMMCGSIDEQGIRQRIEDPFFSNTVSILAIENDIVVGRIEYHFYGCMQDGFRMAYVDWVYVLPQYRRKGIAKALFRAFEQECSRLDIDQYYLIQAEGAEKFYASFRDVEKSREKILRKYMKKEA